MNEVVEHKNAIVLVYIAYATGYINSEGTGTWIFGLIYLDQRREQGSAWVLRQFYRSHLLKGFRRRKFESGKF